MTDANMNSKPHLDMIEHQREFMKGVKVAMGRMRQAIQEAEAEGVLLVQQEAELEASRGRGESPDPNEVTRVRDAQAAFIQQMNRWKMRQQELVKQAEAITQMADEGLFHECVRQFQKQFGTKEGL